MLNFNIFNNINDFHTCYVLKEIKHNNILTSACQLHFIELPKYVESIQTNSKKFTLWLKFFKGVDMSVLKTEDSVFEKVGTVTDKFIDKASFLDTYCKQEAEKYFLRCYIEDEKVAKRLNIAKNLKNDGYDINMISKNTGLSIEEIEKL